MTRRKAISLNLCNVAPLPSPGIVCIHDVKIKARPQDFSKKFLLWYNLLFTNACKRAKKIITVSEFSKKEICKYYKVNPNRVVVILNAWQHYDRIGYDEKTLETYGLEKGKYYFSMSSMEPNKNFKWIAEMAKRNTDQLFAVSGSINKNVFAEGLGFQCPKNMKLLGYVSDEEAKTLMRYCKGFLFPYIYEGFGIPPLEAMSAGCPDVMVSDTPVMHEVFENSVSYIDLESYSIPVIRHCTELNATIMAQDFSPVPRRKSAGILGVFQALTTKAQAKKTSQNVAFILGQCLRENIHKSKDRLAKYSWEKSAIKLKKELLRIG